MDDDSYDRAFFLDHSGNVRWGHVLGRLRDGMSIGDGVEFTKIVKPFTGSELSGTMRS